MPCGQLVVIFIILKGFKSRKKWRFSNCGPAKNVIFGHFTCLHISHPNERIFTVVVIILNGFLDCRKIEVFMTAALRRNTIFFFFCIWHFLAYFSSKWARVYISNVFWSTGGYFHHFKRLCRKSKKLKYFMSPDLRKKMSFLDISLFCTSLIKLSKCFHFKCSVAIW